MDWLRNSRRRIAVAAALILCAAFTESARADERPAIAGVRVYVAGNVIVTEVRCVHLFTEQVIGTVESGLPAVVELAYRLLDKKHNDVHRGVHSFRLGYDVWDDVYSFERGDSTAQFASFDELRRAVEQLRRVPIVGIHDVQAAGVYSIELSVAVHPLRGGEQGEIVGWVDETVRASSDGSWREQLLNVNGLIHRFFSRDQAPSNQSDWFETILFTPASLPLDRTGGGGER